jgi:hypothetical protein
LEFKALAFEGYFGIQSFSFRRFFSLAVFEVTVVLAPKAEALDAINF